MMTNQSLGILAAALTGGLAGSALTLIVNWLRVRWLRPQMEVLFDNAEPGCRVDTNVLGETDPTQGYVRFKVKNSGRSTALGVSACVTKLTFVAPGAGSQIYEEDGLNLKLANGRPTPFLLAPGAHRHLDLALVLKPGEPIARGIAPPTTTAAAEFHYIFESIPVRLSEHGFGTARGVFGAEIFAENAAATRWIAIWSWDGGFPGLDIGGKAG